MQDYDPYESPRYSSFVPEGPRSLPHSGLGIASLAVGVLAGVLMCAGIVAAAAAVGTHAPQVAEESPQLVAAGCSMAGCSMLVACGANLVGLALGGAGLAQARNRLFPILGVSLNGLSLVVVAILFVLGTVMG